MYIRAKRISSEPQRRRRGEEPICVAVRINLPQDLRAAGRGSAVTPHFLPFNYPAERRAARARRRAAALSGPASLASRLPRRLRAVCSPRERVCAAVHVRRSCRLRGRGGGVGGGLVGWQTRPVVVTVPAAASGTIWPLWKNLGWSDIRAGTHESGRSSRKKK